MQLFFLIGEINCECKNIGCMQCWDALVRNCFFNIFSMKCTIFANFLYPFKDCHVVGFYVVPKGNPPPIRMLVVPIECRYLTFFFPMWFYIV
jgi:hypothetical protein